MNCKLTIYAWLFASITTSATAQITITNSYFPEAGDSFKIAFATAQTARLVTVTPAGSNQTWNFSSLRSERNNTIYSVEKYKAIAADTAALRQFPNGELIRQTDSGQVAILNRTTTKLELLGFKGFDLNTFNIPNVALRYAPPVNERHAPLVYNAPTISLVSNLTATVASSVFPDSILRQLPIRPDSVRLNYRISRQDKTDAWGTVLLPGATAPVAALRERRFEEVEIRIEAKISILPWFDVTNLALGAIGNGVTQPKDTTISYYFWSNTTKQPLVVMDADSRDSVTSVRYKWQPLLAGIHNTEGVLKDVTMTVYPNPAKANSESFVEIKNWQSTDYTVSIMQMDGKMVSILSARTPMETGKASSTPAFNINLPPLSQGFYMLQLSDGAGVKTVKISVFR